MRFCGRVPDEDLPDLYGCGDVFAMLCRNRWAGLEQEGFGIVFLEAAAAGVPAVAGESGGAAEAVAAGETGLVVDPSTSVDRRGRRPGRTARRRGRSSGHGRGGPTPGREGVRLRRAGRPSGRGPRPVTSERILRRDLGGHGGAGRHRRRWPWSGRTRWRCLYAVVGIACFVAGCAAFVWGYAIAVGPEPHRGAQRRRHLLPVGCGTAGRAAFGCSGRWSSSACHRGRRRGRSSPYTAVAFGVLAPMLGLGLIGLWGARYGTFPARDDERGRRPAP